MRLRLVALDPFGTRSNEATGAGWGLNVSYALVPRVAAYVARDFLVHDLDEAGSLDTWEAGLQLRFPGRPLLWYINAGFGRVSTSEGYIVSYNYAPLGVAADLFFGGRGAVHGSIDVGVPLGDGEEQGMPVKVTDVFVRFSLGFGLHLGPR